MIKLLGDPVLWIGVGLGVVATVALGYALNVALRMGFAPKRGL
jgi:hypothetical protein